MKCWLLLLLAAIALPAQAQFQLFVVNGDLELPAPGVFDLGSVGPSQAATATFRVRNISTAPAAVTVLSPEAPDSRCSRRPLCRKL